MTKEKALKWYDFLMKDMADGETKEALQMGRDALAEKPEESETGEDFCEACQIHYPEEDA